MTATPDGGRLVIEAPSLVLAFAAGFVSFLSPCCLPLVPGYLAAVRGVGPGEERRRLDPGVLWRSLAFVATFSLIFVLFGLSATLLGSLLFEQQRLLEQVAGVAIIAMGVFFIASVFVARINRDVRPRALIARAGSGGPVVAGAAFAVAWTPCVGPTLGAILGLASTSAGTAQGGLLLGVYSAGLAIPFLASAITFTSASRAFKWLGRHHAALQLGGGAVLIVMGVLVISGELFRLNIEAQRLLDGLGLDFLTGI